MYALPLASKLGKIEGVLPQPLGEGWSPRGEGSPKETAEESSEVGRLRGRAVKRR